MKQISVIGAGYWGKNLIRNYAQLGSLHGFYDTDSQQKEKIQAAYAHAISFDTVSDLLDDDQCDGVIIATPAETHGALARQALEAGKNVFVEKPLCLNLQEAETLRDLAARNNLILMVGHMLRYHPAFIALKEHVKAGKIGHLRYIYSNRLSLGKIRREENALWSFAPHDISMILALSGATPSQVVSNGEAYLTPGVADTTLTHMTFADGLQAHIFVSWLHPYKEQRLVVVGSEGMVVFNDVENGPEKLMHYEHQVGWTDDLPTVEKADAQAIFYDAVEPLAQECRHFLECIESGQSPVTDAQEGINVLSVLDASQRSLVTGQPVNL